MTTYSAPRRRDRLALQKTIFRYSLPSHLTALFVVVVVFVLWLTALQQVLDFGRTRDYTVFDTLGPEVLTWVQKYNPFFWWGLVIVCSIFILYFLYSFVVFLHRRSLLKPISAHSVQILLNQLNSGSHEVLAWAWDNQREPITVGVLQRTVREIRHGRYQQIKLSQEHAQLLAQARVPTPTQMQTPPSDADEVLHTF